MVSGHGDSTSNTAPIYCTFRTYSDKILSLLWYEGSNLAIGNQTGNWNIEYVVISIAPPTPDEIIHVLARTLSNILRR